MINLQSLQSVEEKNFQETATRIAEANLLLPFGYDPAKLQPVRRLWSPLVRAYLGKVKPCKGASFIQSVNAIDGEIWHHVSLSYSDRMPGYEELKWARDAFFREDDTVIQVFPRADRHVNIHPYCLHLWCNMERQPLPDFDIYPGVI